MMRELLVLLIVPLTSLANVPNSCLPAWLGANKIAMTPSLKSVKAAHYLVPIGFFPDKKFAYVIGKDDTGCESDDGCKSTLFVIHDLVTDKANSTKLSSQFDLEGVPCEEWKKVEKALVAAKFDFKNVPTLEKFPIKGGQYDVEIIPFTADEPNALVYLKSGADRVKKLGSLNDNYGGAHKPETLGYFKTPFEDRVLVVIGYQTRGWEYVDPTEARLALFGGSLKAGFVTNQPEYKIATSTKKTPGYWTLLQSGLSSSDETLRWITLTKLEEEKVVDPALYEFLEKNLFTGQIHHRERYLRIALKIRAKRANLIAAIAKQIEMFSTELLGELGQDAELITPYLIEILSKASAEKRRPGVAVSLMTLNPNETSRALSYLLECLKDTSGSTFTEYQLASLKTIQSRREVWKLFQRDIGTSEEYRYRVFSAMSEWDLSDLQLDSAVFEKYSSEKMSQVPTRRILAKLKAQKSPK